MHLIRPTCARLLEAKVCVKRELSKIKHLNALFIPNYIHMLHYWILHMHHHISPEDGDSMFLRNAGIYPRVYTAPTSRRSSSNIVLPLTQRLLTI
jgi:hypothetical protein